MHYLYIKLDFVVKVKKIYLMFALLLYSTCYLFEKIIWRPQRESELTPAITEA